MADTTPDPKSIPVLVAWWGASLPEVDRTHLINELENREAELTDHHDSALAGRDATIAGLRQLCDQQATTVSGLQQQHAEAAAGWRAIISQQRHELDRLIIENNRLRAPLGADLDTTAIENAQAWFRVHDPYQPYTRAGQILADTVDALLAKMQAGNPAELVRDPATALTPDRYQAWIARYRTGTTEVPIAALYSDARWMLAAIDDLCDEKSRLQHKNSNLTFDLKAKEIACPCPRSSLVTGPEQADDACPEHGRDSAAAAAERLRLIGAEYADADEAATYGILDRFRVGVTDTIEGPGHVVYTRCGGGCGNGGGTVKLIVRDLKGSQAGLTLAELVHGALEHIEEEHDGVADWPVVIPEVLDGREVTTVSAAALEPAAAPVDIPTARETLQAAFKSGGRKAIRDMTTPQGSRLLLGAPDNGTALTVRWADGTVLTGWHLGFGISGCKDVANSSQVDLTLIVPDDPALADRHFRERAAELDPDDGANTVEPADPADTEAQLCSDKNGFHDPHTWRADPCDDVVQCPGYPVPKQAAPPATNADVTA